MNVKRKVLFAGVVTALVLTTGASVATAAVKPAGPSGPGPAGAATAGPGGLKVTVVTDGDSYIGDDYDFATAECPASAPYVVAGTLAASRLPGL
jgi:hypothetical protein